jgi:predicted TIM-barrel fold metal-dependent hydrolase
MKIAPLSQILLGTDSPFTSLDPLQHNLAALGLPPASLRMIERGNALELLPRLKST